MDCASWTFYLSHPLIRSLRTKTWKWSDIISSYRKHSPTCTTHRNVCMLIPDSNHSKHVFKKIKQETVAAVDTTCWSLAGFFHHLLFMNSIVEISICRWRCNRNFLKYTLAEYIEVIEYNKKEQLIIHR